MIELGTPRLLGDDRERSALAPRRGVTKKGSYPSPGPSSSRHRGYVARDGGQVGRIASKKALEKDWAAFIESRRTRKSTRYGMHPIRAYGSPIRGRITPLGRL